MKPKKAITKDLKDKEDEVSQWKNRAEKAEAEEIKLRKGKRELEQSKEKFELEKQRQLDEERETIKKQATQTVEAKFNLIIAEKDKQATDMKKPLRSPTKR